MSIDPVSLGISLALSAGSMALNASRTIEGPRLDSTKFTGGDYGAPLPLTWGTRRHECPIFWAEDLREVRRRRKTKGGKFNDYSYRATWAVALAGHEISGVTRIWFDTHLVYNVTGAGPVTPFDFGEAGNVGDFVTIYLGSETQEPDPRMQATVEAEFGEGSCPAYRGTAYIVFKDVPVEKLGNRIPQVSVEMTSAGTASLPWETFATVAPQPDNLQGVTFSTDFSRLLWAENGDYEIWDVAARSRMIGGTLPTEVETANKLGMYADGTFLGISQDGHDLLTFSPDGLSVTTAVDAFPPVLFDSRVQEQVRVLTDAGGHEFYFTLASTTVPYFYTDALAGHAVSDGLDEVDSADLTMAKLTGVDWQPSEWFNDIDGNVWAVGREMTSGVTTAYFRQMTGGSAFLTVTGLAAITGGSGECTACVAPNGQFVLAWDSEASGHLYAVDPASGTVTDSLAISLDVHSTPCQFANFRAGSSTIWLSYSTDTAYEVDLNTLTVLRTLDLGDWKAESADGVIYDPVNHALVCFPPSTQVITWRYLDRVTGGGVTLGTICGDVADLCGVAVHDFSALDQVVQGWSATRGRAVNMVSPLLDAFDSEVGPHDFGLSGFKRSGVSGGTIAASRFARGNPRYTVQIRQPAELPRGLMVNFADVDADQQPNSTRSSRPLAATGGKGEQAIDLGTWATDATEARGIADRYFRRLWNERATVSLSLTAQHLALEPGDCRTLDLDGEASVWRLTSLTVRADGSLASEWKADDPSLAVIDGAAGAAFDGRGESVISVGMIARALVLDVPLLADADSAVSPLVYAMASPYGEGAWPGATIFEAVDGEYSNEIASVAASGAATWGTVAGALGDSNPNLWDRLNTITVTLQRGDLTGTTEAAIDANPRLNLAAIGASGRWEIVQFTTATLVSGKTFTVSGFKRGRRGTEWASGLHAAGDIFVLLDAAQAVAMGLSDVGTTESFKAVTSGRTEASAFATTIAPFTGASLKPYAPCHLAAVQDGSDWDLAWVRRTRIGGAWTSGTPIPLGEAAEEYELEIMDGATVKRTVTGLTSAAYTYASADQTTDFGAPLTSAPAFRVYQMSDTVGRGFVAEFP